MLLQSDEEVEEEKPIEPTEPPPTQAATESTFHHLSLNAMKGSHSLGTIRFKGHIGNISVQILVDGGSSDNFLQPRIAQFLKLPIEPAPLFKVLVGNGQSMTAEGMIQHLPVAIQGHDLTVPVYRLPIAGADLVLGTSWLATLGPHVSDYSALTIKFYYNGKFVTLQGDHTPGANTSSVSSFKENAAY